MTDIAAKRAMLRKNLQAVESKTMINNDSVVDDADQYLMNESGIGTTTNIEDELEA